MRETKKIVVIDDEVEVTNALDGLLREEGYEVVVINDETKSMDVIERVSPDLILLDVKMPQLNGIELLKQIKQYNKDIKIVMISGKSTAEDVMESLHQGAENFITKPFDVDNVKRRVAECLNMPKYIG